MPYVGDYETLLHEYTKRQKLSGSKMARRSGRIEEHIGADVHNKGQGAENSLDQRAPTNPTGPKSEQEIRTSDREELMECIKRGQRPKWVPKPTLEALCAEEDALIKQRAFNAFRTEPHAASTSPTAETDKHASITLGRQPDTRNDQGRALHSGDFRIESKQASYPDTNHDPFVDNSPTELSTSPPPWLDDSSFSSIGRATSNPRPLQGLSMSSIGRQRAPSLGSSLSSSFVLRTPTSPLVNAISNSSLDITSSSSLATVGADIERQRRRRTMPPHSFQSLQLSPVDGTPNFSRPLQPLHLRREVTLPIQRHQMRRSLSSFTYQPTAQAQAPQMRARRPSIASDSFPRQRTSMVGSFEESILRGRMSSPASKPFDFIAQIGVMGKGDCPPSLKCPAHVTVAFRAVFYSYPGSNNARTISDDAPSPYVGTIDLQNSLKPIQFASKRKKYAADDKLLLETKEDPSAPENTRIGKALAREQHKQGRRSSSPKVNLGGAYRVPQQGQLQIIIKNPNKTAVKLFLVPYDLTDMGAGTKTFVRQRSYSSGPIFEGISNIVPASSGLADPLQDKSILRYLIHIKFCCPTKGRYYLHDSIRVVFANRVPDGKEKLRNEVQLPEPRYSTYRQPLSTPKSTRSSTLDFSAFDTTFSSASGTFRDMTAPKTPESYIIPEECPDTANAISSHHLAGRTRSPKQDFYTPTKSTNPTVSLSHTTGGAGFQRALSPVQGFLPSTSARASPIPWGSNSTSSTNRSFSPIPVEAGSGLLSRQFRTLNELSEPSRLDDTVSVAQESANINSPRKLSHRSKSPQDES